MPRASRRHQSIFEANQSLDFESFDPRFRQGLRSLVLYVKDRGGVPAMASTQTGFPVGKWLHAHQVNPHILGSSERAVLLSIPGIRLSSMPRSTRVVVQPAPAKSLLWARLQAWAVDPRKDPISARRIEVASRAAANDEQ